MDSNDKVGFKPIYVVIRPGLVIVHNMDPRPIDPSKAPFVLIVMKPDRTGSMINNITATYVYGMGTGEYIESQIDQLDLNSLLQGNGSTVLEKLQFCFLSLSGPTLQDILSPTDPELNGFYAPDQSSHVTETNASTEIEAIVYPRQPSFSFQPNSSTFISKKGYHKSELSFPGSTDFERFMTAFMAGVGSHLALLDIIKHQQSMIGDPFSPLEIRFPTCKDEPEDLLTSGVGKYLSYHARTLQAIARGEKSITRVGPTWLTMIDHFWNGFARCFSLGSVNDSSTAIHDTMVGYCRHQDRKIRKIETRFAEISARADHYLNSIQTSGRSILDQIEMTAKSTMEEMTKVSKEMVNSMVKSSTEFEAKIKDLSTTSINTIQEERRSTISSITTVRADAQRDIHRWTDEGVEQIQAVYSQGYEEITTVKVGALADIKGERQQSLDLISARQDGTLSELGTVQTGIIKDLAELHNEGINKNFAMVEDRKRDLLQLQR